MSETATASAGPIVLYELNEVPWRVVDWYVAERPGSSFARVLRDAETYTSLTRDQGDLSPWITWPTLHRSVYNTTHNIRFINQDLSCAAAYPPLWEILARAGKKVGVFGSLQSYPPPSDPQYAFFVPDTFAAGPETIPARYTCYQRFNLRQTSTDRAVAKPVQLDGSAATDILRLFGNGLTVKTACRLAAQLVSERRSGLYRSRRPLLQAPVSFDVFRHSLARTHPDFCSYFTNHVASIMHRYWKYAFPEDFGYRLDGERDAFHRQSLLVALDYADEQIAFLSSYVAQRGGRLYIASSMGQEAVHQPEEDEVYIEDMNRFMSGLGVEDAYKPLMAMHPQYSFELESEAHAQRFAAIVNSLRRADGAPAFFVVDLAGRTVSCSIGSGDGFRVSDGGALYRDGAHLPFDQIGLGVVRRDVGTGYHQPEGILVRYGAGIAPDASRKPIETVDIAPLIIADLGVSHPRAPSAGLRPSSVRIEAIERAVPPAKEVIA